MTSKTKNRLLAAIVIAVILGVAAVILIAQPASVKADAVKPSTLPTESATAAAPSSTAAAALPNISAANPGQLNSSTPTALPPDQAAPSDQPKASAATESYKHDAEQAGMEFLKIYFNSPGYVMENPGSYLEKIAPYASKDFLTEMRGPSPKLEWSPFGQFMHDKKLDYSVDATCSLAAGQSEAPTFDEEKGGNMPCTFTQTVVGLDGKEYTGSDLGVKSKSTGTQSLKMVKEDNAWKVAAIDAYGQ